MIKHISDSTHYKPNPNWCSCTYLPEKTFSANRSNRLLLPTPTKQSHQIETENVPQKS